ncbi:MAG: acyltransferase family protein [Opitutales bacterium]
MPEKSARLASLDALRGCTVLAMIIVNTPGTWSAMYAPLRHAPWHGLTPTDLIFPFFLFIVGVSVALAYGPERFAGKDTPKPHRKVLVRALKIFGVGLFLALWPTFAWGDLRFAGVLQRIALVFAGAALLHLHLRMRGLVVTTAGLLLASWALLTLVPVPRDAVNARALAEGVVERAWGTEVAVEVEARGDAFLAPNLEPGTNLGAWLDRHLLPGTRYETTWDPEGWLGTLNALATGLLGVLAGRALRRVSSRSRQTGLLAVSGLALLTAGYGWSLLLPLNKNLWTSSYVLVSVGWALLLWAPVLWLVDGRGWRRPAWPGIVLGANAITAYVLAGMLTVVAHATFIAGRSPAAWVLAGADALGLSAAFGSFLFSLLYAGVVFLPVWWLYRRRLFIRL